MRLKNENDCNSNSSRGIPPLLLTIIIFPKHFGAQRECTNTTSCGTHHFPRTDPVAIVLAHSGDECLLTRKAAFAPGVYSLVAGFMEHGESAEEAVARELEEETGTYAIPLSSASFVI